MPKKRKEVKKDGKRFFHSQGDHGTDGAEPRPCVQAYRQRNTRHSVGAENLDSGLVCSQVDRGTEISKEKSPAKMVAGPEMR